MERRRSELERVLAASAGSLRRLAWLLTGDADRASGLLKQALGRAFLAPGGRTDRERL